MEKCGDYGSTNTHISKHIRATLNRLLDFSDLTMCKQFILTCLYQDGVPAALLQKIPGDQLIPVQGLQLHVQVVASLLFACCKS